MTPTEAAGLAIVGASHRRLLTAIVRAVRGAVAADDQEALPLRECNESILEWACRCRAGRLTDDSAATAVEIAGQATRQLAEAARLGIHALAIPDTRYPTLLAAIPDPPPLLWARGAIAALTRPAIAIVGSRAGTAYALTMARQLSRDLAAAGAVIVSGLARGVDSAAHAGALDAKGSTVGVLGCGIDRIYPAEHRDLARDIEHAGAVVSEFPVGVPPLPHHFPLRNRIISGLSTAVVVVEAPEKSGSLITAAAAVEQGRDVMVVPGPVTGGRNRGGHLLIRDGAKVVESADDILQDIGFASRVTRTASNSEREMLGIGQLPESADFSIDDVAERFGEAPGTVLARLLELELTGKIQRIGGGRYIRVLT
jgi:DNA processing protein